MLEGAHGIGVWGPAPPYRANLGLAVTAKLQEKTKMPLLLDIPILTSSSAMAERPICAL